MAQFQPGQTIFKSDTNVKIAMVDLGRMGGNTARRLLRDGHQVVAFYREEGAVAARARDGATAASRSRILLPRWSRRVCCG